MLNQTLDQRLTDTRPTARPAINQALAQRSPNARPTLDQHLTNAQPTARPTLAQHSTTRSPHPCMLGTDHAWSPWERTIRPRLCTLEADDSETPFRPAKALPSQRR